MSMVAWSFLDLHTSYSGWTSARPAVSVVQGRDALEQLDPSEPAEQEHALAPVVQPQRTFRLVRPLVLSLLRVNASEPTPRPRRSRLRALDHRHGLTIRAGRGAELTTERRNGSAS